MKEEGGGDGKSVTESDKEKVTEGGKEGLPHVTPTWVC